MKTIICSHGFGVRADSRGMFPEIASALPDDKFIMFDYNHVRENGDTIVSSLENQAAKLQKVIDKQETGSVLLCHSQGCIVAGMVDLSNITQVILLAPPVTLSMQRLIERMLARPGSALNVRGVSKLPRSDGSTTYLSNEYLQSLQDKHPLKLYEQIAYKKPTVIVRATKDEVVGLTNVNEISRALHVDISADHNFTGKARIELIDVLKMHL